MKYAAIKRLVCLILLGLFAYQANGSGLTEYLQNPEATEIAANTLTTTSSTATDPSLNITAEQAKESAQLKSIIELVVAGIVAAALIIVVLVLFLGRWLAGKEKRLIKELRMEAEENSEEISSASKKVREQEKQTSQIAATMRDQATTLSAQQESTAKFSDEIQATATNVKEQEQAINQVSNSVSENMRRIQKYWDSQVNETVDTLSLFQHNLNEKMNFADEGLDQINEKKALSDELLQDLLDKYIEQSTLVENNSEISTQVSKNLAKAHSESTNLLELIKTQQQQAEAYLSEYSTRLNNFEEQAYEQFDTSFQVADLARQELSANLDENRKHIETMRRQEEQSHTVNNQIAKNLEALDYSKIVKISQTLDNTQNMFEEIHHKVEETRSMLDELKQIEQDIKQTASSVENVARSQVILEEQANEIDELIEATEAAIENQTTIETDSVSVEEAVEALDALDKSAKDIRENTTIAITDYKMASGDSSTPLSFFRGAKNNANKIKKK